MFSPCCRVYVLIAIRADLYRFCRYLVNLEIVHPVVTCGPDRFPLVLPIVANGVPDSPLFTAAARKMDKKKGAWFLNQAPFF
jgi:hypothetical protein